MKSKQYTTKGGETLTLIPVSQADLIPFATKLLPSIPQAPVEVIKTATGEKEFTNENDSEYLKAKQEFEITEGVFMAAAIIELGLDIDFSDDDQRKIDRRKAKLEKLFPGQPENQLDNYIYVKMLCDQDEVNEIMTEIMSINTPTAPQVQAHLDTFRIGVQGSPDNADKDAPKWNNFKEPQLEVDAVPGGALLEDRPNPFLRTVGPRVAG